MDDEDFARRFDGCVGWLWTCSGVRDGLIRFDPVVLRAAFHAAEFGWEPDVSSDADVNDLYTPTRCLRVGLSAHWSATVKHVARGFETSVRLL